MSTATLDKVIEKQMSELACLKALRGDVEKNEMDIAAAKRQLRALQARLTESEQAYDKAIAEAESAYEAAMKAAEDRRRQLLSSAYDKHNREAEHVTRSIDETNARLGQLLQAHRYAEESVRQATASIGGSASRSSEMRGSVARAPPADEDLRNLQGLVSLLSVKDVSVKDVEQEYLYVTPEGKRCHFLGCGNLRGWNKDSLMVLSAPTAARPLGDCCNKRLW